MYIFVATLAKAGMVPVGVADFSICLVTVILVYNLRTSFWLWLCIWEYFFIFSWKWGLCQIEVICL